MRVVEIEVAGVSSAGPIRERNEDQLGLALLGDPSSVWMPPGDGSPFRVRLEGPAIVLAVADGLGGHGGGGLASRRAIGILLDAMASADADSSPGTVMRSAFERANAALVASDFGALSTARFRDPQTTLTALVLTGGSTQVAHVGDCRLYRLRDSILDLVTRDHSQAMDLVRMRVIRPDQAATHPGRHLLTRSIGGDLAVRVETHSDVVTEGDAFLLGSDGLWGGVTSSEIRQVLEGDLASGVAWLHELSLTRDGHDNASVITVRVLGFGDGSRPASPRPNRSLWRRIRGQ